MTMVSELVLTRNQLLEIVRRHEDSEFKAPLQRLSNVTAELQEGVMKTRMQPIGNAWQKLPRIVRDLSRRARQADRARDARRRHRARPPGARPDQGPADPHGAQLRRPRHRNRRPSGAPPASPEKGTIRLSAWHRGRPHHHRGRRRRARPRRRADQGRRRVASGLATEAEIEKMSEAQIHKFIFAPGFSTASQVTSVSGRGVGMDVVRTNIDQIGGTIDVKSVLGQRHELHHQDPAHARHRLGADRGAAGDRFAIPQLAVVELVRVRGNSEHRIERIKDAAVLRLRNKLLPLVHLKSTAQARRSGSDDAENGFIVVTQVGSQTFGIVVDGVFHTEEIVVKPMSSRLRNIALFCGNTILGDGSVIMIIDPNGARHMRSAARLPRSRRPPTQREIEQRSRSTRARESLLVFRAGSPQPKAVPLSLVTRLEEIDAKTIETLRTAARWCNIAASSCRSCRSTTTCAIKDERRAAAPGVRGRGPRRWRLVVDEIVDIVEERLASSSPASVPACSARRSIKGQATEVIDIAHYLPLAFEDWLHWKAAAQRTGAAFACC